MAEQGEVTLGEVYRICRDIKALQEKTNGRVTDLETDVAVLKDRGTRDNAARSMGAGSLLAGAGTFLWNLFKQP